MPIKILMPALSPTMTEGNLAKWLKNEGDKIVPGDVIAEIETDKATMEVEAVDAGVLAKIIIKQGTDNVPVNSLIAILLEEGEDASVLDNISLETAPLIAPKTAKEEKIGNILSEKILTENLVSHKASRIYASPLAKRLAVIDNIDLSNITGSGPHGRIVKKDLLQLSAKLDKSLAENAANKNAVARNAIEYRTVANNNIRKIIAKRLLESKQTIPHFYLSIECNMDKLLDTREDINKFLVANNGAKISVNDFVILAVAKALKEVPAANASWDEASIRYYNNIDVSIAVAIEDGLITPVIRNANQKDLVTISTEMKDLAKRARDNKLKPEEFQGGGFSISNLGMYGVKSFSAIINPPQSCILAVGSSSKRVIVINDQIKIATIMDITLSADHRVVDGAVGAEFLASFKKFIESPALLMI